MRTRRASGGLWTGLSLPVQLVVAAVVIGLVLLGLRLVEGDPGYHVRLRHSAGLEAGDDVRVAGLKVGTVTAVTTDRDQVDVSFALTQDPADVGLTKDSAVEVKLLSILGERFLALAPGSGEVLADGATIDVRHALDSYTMDRFWLESVPAVQDLDLPTLQRAINVLATDLAVAPDELNRALKGISGVSRMVTDRREQLDSLLTSTRNVTELVIDQTDTLDTILTKGALVMAMVQQRQQALRTLLAEAHRFVTGLTEVVDATAPELAPGLRDLRSFLDVLDQHRQDLAETLRLAGPTMRVFTNSAGDGPWLGVNAPYAILPDNLLCTVLPEDCS
ncbi:MCE family protein [Nocardioides sp. BGMRC 2183]|nr:MCE family protein [Nocardioides sp. BGMRC 2183]